MGPNRLIIGGTEPTSRTWTESGYALASALTSRCERFWSNSSLTRLVAAVDDIAAKVGVSVSPTERSALVAYLKTL